MTEGAGGAPGAPTAAFGALLRGHRRTAGLTQEALAERAGLSRRGLQRLESGDARPYPATLAALAAALDLEPREAARLRAAAAPRRGAAAPANGLTNLPLQLTSFVGREDELAAVSVLVAAHRLVTLTGPGGVGKTRLALQIAAEVRPAYADGVWLVDLAALPDPALVPQAVAGAVGVREEPGRPLLATLTDALRPRHLLLVLDNCEHLLDACARLADALLRACPRLRILATSREALGVPGDVPWRVPSLAVPDALQPLQAPHLWAYAAARLFIDRAQAALPGFAVTDRGAGAVAQVCRRLDGIPLAIELAAARIRTFTPDQLLPRLEDRFRLLTGGSRTALPRQQTLRATVDWSYALLSASEQALFARLSVFAGGWTLDAAEAVCADGAVDRFEVDDLLGRLVDKSLVGADDFPDGSRRYRLLETLRQYARERLQERGDAAPLHARHAAYFGGDWCATVLGAAASGGPWPPSAWDRRAWHEQTSREHENLRAALRWFADAGAVEPGLRLSLALSGYWFHQRSMSEGAQWLGAFLAADAGRRTAPVALRAQALDAAGHLAQLLGDYEASTRLRAEGVGLWREVGDAAQLAVALIALGADHWLHGEYARAEAVVQEALGAARRRGDPGSVCRCLRLLAQVARVRRDFDRAAALLEESLTVAGDAAPFHALRAHCLLGRIAFERGRHREATAHLAAGIALIQVDGSPRHLADGLEWLAAVNGATGRAARAARLFGAAATFRHETGEVRYPPDRAAFERDLSRVRAQLAAAAFATAFAEGQAMPLNEAVAYALEGGVDGA
jgi:non-specific serine/threonine protein kinase